MVDVVEQLKQTRKGAEEHAKEIAQEHGSNAGLQAYWFYMITGQNNIIISQLDLIARASQVSAYGDLSSMSRTTAEEVFKYIK